MRLEATKFRPREVVNHVLQTAAASLQKLLTLEGHIAVDVPVEVMGLDTFSIINDKEVFICSNSSRMKCSVLTCTYRSFNGNSSIFFRLLEMFYGSARFSRTCSGIHCSKLTLQSLRVLHLKAILTVDYLRNI